MRVVDVHSHTCFSIDSKNTIEASCEAAVKKGMRGVSITDHLDSNPKEWGFGFYDPEGYFKEIERVKGVYGDQIELLSGIEFSESQIYGDKLEAMAKYPYDVVLGSVHWIDAGYVGDREILDVLTQEEVERRYYDAILKVIQGGKIDVLAHLDLPKRTFGKSVIPQEVLTHILIELVKSNIALEINTSSLRKGLNETMPDYSLVEEFVSLGGKRVTLGSDAHFSDVIGADFDTVLMALSQNARQYVGYFVKREFVSLPAMESKDLLGVLGDYKSKYPNELESIELFEAFVNGDGERLTMPQQRGHITGSAWIVNKDRDKALLTHHHKLNIWVQLGGHVEVTESVLQGAIREAHEESGLKSIRLLSEAVFDIDAHIIPESKKHSEHTHFDIRFMFEADEAEELVITPESKDLKWVEFSKIPSYTMEESVLRMVRKSKLMS